MIPDALALVFSFPGPPLAGGPFLVQHLDPTDHRKLLIVRMRTPPGHHPDKRGHLRDIGKKIFRVLGPAKAVFTQNPCPERVRLPKGGNDLKEIRTT